MTSLLRALEASDLQCQGPYRERGELDVRAETSNLRSPAVRGMVPSRSTARLRSIFLSFSAVVQY